MFQTRKQNKRFRQIHGREGEEADWVGQAVNASFRQIHGLQID
jgi:hypothetical protein